MGGKGREDYSEEPRRSANATGTTAIILIGRPRIFRFGEEDDHRCENYAFGTNLYYVMMWKRPLDQFMMYLLTGRAEVRGYPFIP